MSAEITHDQKETGLYNIGDIKTNKYFTKFIWCACIVCRNERWVQISQGKPLYERCKKCAASDTSKRTRENSHRWKGGRRILRNGYIDILLAHDDFFYPMVNARGVVREHRLFIARHLGRCLQKWELVHHKNGNRQDNHLENLKLTTTGSHIIEHNKGYRDGYLQGYNDGKNKIIQELKQHIQELELQIRGGKDV